MREKQGLFTRYYRSFFNADVGADYLAFCLAFCSMKHGCDDQLFWINVSCLGGRKGEMYDVAPARCSLPGIINSSVSLSVRPSDGLGDGEPEFSFLISGIIICLFRRPS